MRMLMRIEVPVEAGNAAIKNGTLAHVIQQSLKELQPEAMYLTTVNGYRGGYVVFNLDDASQIPLLTEPLFQALNARVELAPCFTPQELLQAVSTVQQVAETEGA